MTNPEFRILDPNATPGESEFSWGEGLQAPRSRGHIPTPLEELKAQQRTRNEYSFSTASYDAEPGTLNNRTAVRWEKETGPSTPEPGSTALEKLEAVRMPFTEEDAE